MFSLTGGVNDEAAAAKAWVATVGAADGPAAEAQAMQGLNYFLLGLKKGTVVLSSIITGSLGQSLTSTDALVRARAIELMATLLERLPSLRLEPYVRAPFAAKQRSSGPQLEEIKHL